MQLWNSVLSTDSHIYWYKINIGLTLMFCDARMFHPPKKENNNCRWLVEIQFYTVRQFCRITLLVWMFCLTAIRNLCNANIMPDPGNTQMTSSDPLTKFSFVLSRPVFFGTVIHPTIDLVPQTAFRYFYSVCCFLGSFGTFIYSWSGSSRGGSWIVPTGNLRCWIIIDSWTNVAMIRLHKAWQK